MRQHLKSFLSALSISLMLVGGLWSLGSGESQSTGVYPSQFYGNPYGSGTYGYPYGPRIYGPNFFGDQFHANLNPKAKKKKKKKSKRKFKGFNLDFNKGKKKGAKGKIKKLKILKPKKTVKVLGIFGNTKGKVRNIVKKKIKGAKKFKLVIVGWALGSWDNEPFTIFVNGKKIKKFRYSFGDKLNTLKKGKKKKGKKKGKKRKKKTNFCKSIKGRTNVKLQDRRWTSTAFKCEFNGRLKGKKLFVAGKNVTSSKKPSTMGIGVKVKLNQKTSDEAWAIQKISLKPIKKKKKKRSLRKMARNIPHPINIYVGVPMHDLNQQPQQPVVYPAPLPPQPPVVLPQPQVQPAQAPPPLAPPVPVNQNYLPSYYAPSPGDGQGRVDITAGYLTSDLMSGSADPCAACLIGSQNNTGTQNEICRTQCVGISKEEAQSILSRYSTLKGELDKAMAKIQTLEGQTPSAVSPVPTVAPQAGVEGVPGATVAPTPIVTPTEPTVQIEGGPPGTTPASATPPAPTVASTSQVDGGAPGTTPAPVTPPAAGQPGTEGVADTASTTPPATTVASTSQVEGGAPGTTPAPATPAPAADPEIVLDPEPAVPTTASAPAPATPAPVTDPEIVLDPEPATPTPAIATPAPADSVSDPEIVLDPAPATPTGTPQPVVQVSPPEAAPEQDPATATEAPSDVTPGAAETAPADAAPAPPTVEPVA